MVQRYLSTRLGRVTGAFLLSLFMFASNDAFAQYCIPTQAPGWGAYGGIARVTCNDLDYVSPFCNANCYTNTGAVVNMLRQVPTTVTVLAQNGQTLSFQVAVWIDLNQDGTFAATEQVTTGWIYANFIYDGAGFVFTYTPFVGTFNLPCAALLGQTKMRVRMHYPYVGFGMGPCDPMVGGSLDFEAIIGGDIVQSFPDDISDALGLLTRGNVYDGTAGNPRPSVTLRVGSANQQLQTTYRITGPLPETTPVYIGHQVGNPNNTTFTVSGPSAGPFPRTFQFDVPAASGTLAGVNGALNTTNAIGGEYQVRVTVNSSAGCFSDWTKTFTIAVDRDMSTRLIRSPRTNEPPSRFKYPNTVAIPVEAQFQNVGLQAAEEFNAIATITSPSGVVSYRDTVFVDQVVAPRARTTVTFRNYTAVGLGHEVGLHSLSICSDLITPFPDQNSYNDCLPRPGQANYLFEVGYNEEAGVEAINVPNTTNTFLYANRPIRPEGTFNNGGIMDLSNVPVRLIIRRNGTVVYNRTGIIPDIGAGQFNKAIFVFDAFTPTEGGDYEFCFSVEYPGDPVTANNQLCQVFTFRDNLNGVYTIGNTETGKPRNFPTFDSAMNEMYRAGVRGPVTFELTDASYTITNTNQQQPALDMSARIIGASSTNTITFKPSLQRSLQRGSVTIRLRSGNGVGILLGQNLTPANPNAVQNQQYFSSPTNANSAGYITWDGGSQKSIRVTIERSVTSPSPFLAAFYLNSGSTNNTIQNMLIEHSTFVAPTYAHQLPIARYNGGSQEFRFDPNTVNLNQSFTAGIVNRDTVAVFNLGNLDTIPNNNNAFLNNEISGFGYGVVSMGLGVLIKSGVNEFRGYYNQGNRIENNTIFNVRRAGIFLGYEEGARVVGNRIYNVGVAATGGAVNDAAGIILGGETRYNNVDAVIARNEISGVRGNTWSRGIVVEQVRNEFQSVVQAGGVVMFPNRAEHTLVQGNAVWGLSRGAANTNMAGIHLWTRRAITSDPVLGLVNPFSTTYFTRADSVVNNTVVLSNDNIVGTGAIAGIGVQHANGPVVINNAIAALGATNAAAISHSALLYEGTLFRQGAFNTDYLPANAPAALVSNRNAFWTPNAAIARFIEISETSELVSAGDQNEFTMMSQWRNWTRQDINSMVGDFVADHVFDGIAPNQRLRVRTNPLPIGSILNNRGERIASVTHDIDGGIRGESGGGYDIGADEFNGRLYVSDLEAVDILSPAAYRRVTGTTSDAEYVMTTAPVDVRARFRNNGSMATTNAAVRVRIFMETAASNNAELTTPAFNTIPVVDRTVQTGMASGEIKDIQFSIPNWTPQVYFGLGAYTAPTRFASMVNNVSPRYRIEVTTASDEFTPNNTQSKVVRFYILKSQLHMVVSTRGASTNVLTGTPTQNQIAGRLNADSVMRYLADLGWRNDPANNTYAYDVIDRNAWEERAVNYTIYRTMFWSHDQSAFTRNERDDIRNFINSGTPTEKKNLAIGSQEPARRHIGLNVINDEMFVRRILRATNIAPGTPVPAPTNSYHGRRIHGFAISRNAVETVSRTGFTNDAEPQPALVRLFNDALSSGLVSMAYSYNRTDRTTASDSIMGTAIAGLSNNTVFLGVDWRHYGKTGVRTGGERVMRGVIDFFETNGGQVVPVELVAFDAKDRGNNVDVFWSTASEQNSDRFEVERASVSDAGTSEFALVATVPAAGNTTEQRDYRVADQGLAPGSYLYRLHMVDVDGSSSRSQEVAVTIGDATGALWISDVTPNPVATSANITFGSSTNEPVELKLFNMNGNEVATVFTGALSGSTSESFTTGILPAGVYTLVLRSGSAMVTKNVTIVR